MASALTTTINYQEPQTMPYQTVGDLNMFYREQGSGTPVVFIHGNTASSAWWDYTLARLADAPYRCIAPDLRGRGDTGGDASSYTIESLAGEVRGLLEALDIGAAHLVGHSLGACVAMQYALDHKSDVLSLTLLAPGWVAGDMPAAIGDPARLKAFAADRAFLRTALRAVAANVPEAEWPYFAEASMKQSDEAYIQSGPALLGWNVAARLGELAGLPTLVVRGAADPLIPPTVAAMIVEGVPGARLVEVAEATHSPNIERPDEWVALLRAHLEKVGP
jgi:pimeloyl-ACP methyl ester carboxylesterase